MYVESVIYYVYILRTLFHEVYVIINKINKNNKDQPKLIDQFPCKSLMVFTLKLTPHTKFPITIFWFRNTMQ